MSELLTLGKYKLYEVLGSGAFGTVYRATDGVGRTVALKVLKPMLSSDPGIVARFQQEARQAGELFHPRIASILDFDEADGRVFFAMRYIAGESLDRRLKRSGALSYAEAATIFAQAAEALDYAHTRGLVHRDVKPANIMLGADGAVLTDFGLVRAATSSGLSTSSAMIGTPSYMPPEVWDGTQIGPQTDVYALGCVLYEMLTGQVLFGGDTTPVIMKKHFSPLRLPESWPEGVPAGLGELLRAMLTPELAARPASAGECVRRLRALEAPILMAPAEPVPSGRTTGEPEPAREAGPASLPAITVIPATTDPASQKAATDKVGPTPVRAAASVVAAEPKKLEEPKAVASPELKETATAAVSTPDAAPRPTPQIVPWPALPPGDFKASGASLSQAGPMRDPGSGFGRAKSSSSWALPLALILAIVTIPLVLILAVGLITAIANGVTQPTRVPATEAPAATNALPAATAAPFATSMTNVLPAVTAAPLATNAPGATSTVSPNNIRNFRVLSDTPGELVFSVEYKYVGDQGDIMYGPGCLIAGNQVLACVETGGDGFRLFHGAGSGTLVFHLGLYGPNPMTTDQIYVGMYVGGPSSTFITSQVFDYVKQWTLVLPTPTVVPASPQ